MEEYVSNSHKSRKNQSETKTDKKVEKIVQGKVKTKKKSEVRKFADVFISEDAANVKSYILMDVLIPAFKKAVSDIVTNGIDMILYGESGRNKRNSTSSKVSYRSYYERENDRRRDYSSSRIRNGYNYDDIVLESRGEAEDVLDNIEDIISRYGMASVADLYELVGITGNHTDFKYGWTDIRNASIVHIRDGYLIKMPKALPLD